VKRLALNVCGAALLAGSFGWASAANAAVVDLGTTSPLTITGISGLTQLTFSPSPDTDSKEANNTGTSDYSNDFLPQDPTTVGNGIKTIFALSTAPTFISTTNNPSNGGTFTPTSAFNYAAIHQDSGEVVLFFATAQTSLTLSWLPTDTQQLSNINFYSVASAVPEPSTWGMMLLGFAGLAFAFRQSRRKVAFA
jgi:hypothetical protein